MIVLIVKMLNKLKFLHPTCTFWMLHLSVVLMAQCAGRSLISYLQAADQGAYETVNRCSTCLNRLARSPSFLSVSAGWSGTALPGVGCTRMFPGKYSCLSQRGSVWLNTWNHVCVGNYVWISALEANNETHRILEEHGWYSARLLWKGRWIWAALESTLK